MSTSTQLNEILHTDSQEMPVLSSTVASRYYNCYTDGSSSPGNCGYPLVFLRTCYSWISGCSHIVRLRQIRKGFEMAPQLESQCILIRWWWSPGNWSIFAYPPTRKLSVQVLVGQETENWRAPSCLKCSSWWIISGMSAKKSGMLFSKKAVYFCHVILFRSTWGPHIPVQMLM
jgi:hypothetical protein